MVQADGFLRQMLSGGWGSSKRRGVITTRSGTQALVALVAGGGAVGVAFIQELLQGESMGVLRHSQGFI